MTRRLMLVLAVAVIMAATPRWLTTHPGHEHTLLGTITAVAADQVTLKTRDATVATVFLDGETFGGADRRSLYITTPSTLYRVQMVVPGLY